MLENFYRAVAFQVSSPRFLTTVESKSLFRDEGFLHVADT